MNTFNNTKKSTKLVDDDIKLIGIMNTILNENDPNYFNKKNVSNIYKDRELAIGKATKGELSKELAMLACLKVYTKI